jgi:hypothetical protein
MTTRTDRTGIPRAVVKSQAAPPSSSSAVAKSYGPADFARLTKEGHQQQVSGTPNAQQRSLPRADSMTPATVCAPRRKEQPASRQGSVRLQPQSQSGKLSAPRHPSASPSPLNPDSADVVASPLRQGSSILLGASLNTSDLGGSSSPVETSGDFQNKRLKVFARLRPERDNEDGSAAEILQNPAVTRMLLEDPTIDPECMPLPNYVRVGQKDFQFDAVFNGSHTNSKVYEHCVRGIVDKVMNGFNGAVMCYGQTGTGKTYTMSHLPGSGLGTVLTGSVTRREVKEFPGQRKSKKKEAFSRKNSQSSESSAFHPSECSFGSSNPRRAMPERRRIDRAAAAPLPREQDEIDSVAEGESQSCLESIPRTADEGVLFQAVRDLFATVAQQKALQPKLRVTIRCTYLQLYRDHLQDLLDPDTPYLQLHHRDIGGEAVDDDDALDAAKTPPLTTFEEFIRYYRAGDRHRVVAETKMNKASSRGHSVLTFFIRQSFPGRNPESPRGYVPPREIRSRLVFVDLAGYERLNQVDNCHQDNFEVRKDEARHINLSLSALALVIQSITFESKHVPWRNSNLTRILKPSLSGNSVTAIILTLSPNPKDVVETINTLHFGHNAIQCKAGALHVNVGDIDYKSEYAKVMRAMAELKKQNSALQAQLMEAKTPTNSSYRDPTASPISSPPSDVFAAANRNPVPGLQLPRDRQATDSELWEGSQEDASQGRVGSPTSFSSPSHATQKSKIRLVDSYGDGEALYQGLPEGSPAEVREMASLPKEKSTIETQTDHLDHPNVEPMPVEESPLLCLRTDLRRRSAPPVASTSSTSQSRTRDGLSGAAKKEETVESTRLPDSPSPVPKLIVPRLNNMHLVQRGFSSAEERALSSRRSVERWLMEGNASFPPGGGRGTGRTWEEPLNEFVVTSPTPEQELEPLLRHNCPINGVRSPKHPSGASAQDQDSVPDREEEDQCADESHLIVDPQSPRGLALTPRTKQRRAKYFYTLFGAGILSLYLWTK